MPKYSSIALALLLCAVGCRRSPNVETIESLPTIQPQSGGEMILIPAGSFTMGDSTGRPDETPHTVSVSEFYLDKDPVTQELYEKVMGRNPAKRKDPKCPVERTSWRDAIAFCNKCSELEGLTPCYDLSTGQCNFDADGHRLPTEAEWEYACRAGSTSKYCFGDSESELPQYAWLKPGSQGKTQPVGQKLPNHWGLYDMHGNVWQWCNDWYGENYYKESPQTDPRGPADGKKRVLRGGAWDCTPDKCRSAYREKEFPVYSDACFGEDKNGFRRARRDRLAPFVDHRSGAGGTSLRPGEADLGVPDSVPATPTVRPVPDTPSPALARLKGTIVFVSDCSGTMKIWSMHASGKDVKQLTKGNDPDADPRFSPDGKRIMYTTLRGGFPEIWMMNRDGSDQKAVTKGREGNWSPDGKSIIFINDNQTYVRDLTSGKEALITPKEWERCGVPAFSPDGKHIAVTSRHTGDIGIYILSLDGKENRPLKTEDACCTPQWSKDGKRIICQSVKGHIHQIGVDGKGWEQLTYGNDVQHDARYSPDGKMILFCRAPAPEGPWQICLKKLDGDDEAFVQITKEGSNLLPDWHGDE